MVKLGDRVPGIGGTPQIPDTPVCKCGADDAWVIGRELNERDTWNPKTGYLIAHEIVCNEYWIFCSDCGYDANEEDDPILCKLLLEAR